MADIIKKEMDYADDSFYRIIFICSKKDNITKVLKFCKKKYRQNVYQTILDVENCYSVKPAEIKRDKSYKTNDEWLEWFIDRSDELWITDNFSYEKEIEIATSKNKMIRRI